MGRTWCRPARPYCGACRHEALRGGDGGAPATAALVAAILSTAETSRGQRWGQQWPSSWSRLWTSRKPGGQARAWGTPWRCKTAHAHRHRRGRPYPQHTVEGCVQRHGKTNNTNAHTSVCVCDSIQAATGQRRKRVACTHTTSTLCYFLVRASCSSTNNLNLSRTGAIRLSASDTLNSAHCLAVMTELKARTWLPHGTCQHSTHVPTHMYVAYIVADVKARKHVASASHVNDGAFRALEAVDCERAQIGW